MAYFEVNKKPPLSFPTLTGDIVTFNSQYADLPLKSHVVEVVATQSGSGTPSPSNPRAINGYSAINIWATGKNLVKYPYQTITNTWNGMSVVENNGVLTIEGTQNGVGSFIFGEVNLKKNITYTLSPFYDYLSGNELYMNLTLYDFNNNLVVKNVNLNSSSFTVNNDCTARLYLNPSSGANGKYFHFTVSPQIEVGNGTSYTLYNGTYTTITIGSTVYGGNYDARTGVLTVTHILFTVTNVDSVGTQSGRYFFRKGIPASSYSISMTPTNLDNYMSETYYPALDHSAVGTFFVTSAGSSLHLTPTDQTLDTVVKMNTYLADNPAVCLIPLAESLRQTIQLPPCPIETLLVNNIWADTGDTTLQYPKFG